jgi:hypothetical protein
MNGKEEVFGFYLNKRLSGPLIGAESPAGDDAVKMEVVLEFLVPGMKHGDDAKPGVIAPFPNCKRLKGLIHRLKEDPVKKGFIPQYERIELVRDREDAVKVRAWNELAFASLHPAFLFQGLALRAKPASTGIIGRPRVVTLLAFLKVTPELRGPANLDPPDQFVVVRRLRVLLQKGLTEAAKDLGYCRCRTLGYTIHR